MTRAKAECICCFRGKHCLCKVISQSYSRRHDFKGGGQIVEDYWRLEKRSFQKEKKDKDSNLHPEVLSPQAVQYIRLETTLDPPPAHQKLRTSPGIQEKG